MKKKTTEEFIKKAKEVHGDKYDYSKTVYINSKNKVVIICPTHGEFLQEPDSHTNSKNGCLSCSKNIRKTTEEFIKKAKEVHGDKYDYSKTVYKKRDGKVVIICKIHGEFLQTPSNHINGKNCFLCDGEKTKTTEEFIKESSKLYSSKYDYSKTVYKNARNKVIIICPIHGEFLKSPNCHLAQKQGCPKCKVSKGENTIEKILIENKIIYEKQFVIKECKDVNFLKFDFAIFKNNKLLALIEFDGEQHVKFVKFWHRSIENFEKQKNRDAIKNSYCKNNNILLKRISYKQDIKKEIENILLEIE